jgi:molybdopterin-guanine dinucleotide biosynthesis protein A
MKHHKHPPVGRIEMGEFGRNELGLVGAPCGDIQKLCNILISHLSPLKTSYVDASHDEEERANAFTAASQEWVLHKDFLSSVSQSIPSEFDQRFGHSASDFVLVNGNHFRTKAQVVIADTRKFESLQRKLDRLDNIAFIILSPGVEQIPEFLAKHLGGQDIPTFRSDDIQGMVNHIKETLVSAPALSGVVLAGGKSTRMGHDKGTIDFHGSPQREYMYSTLAENCDDVYMSCRQDQAEELKTSFNTIEDRLIDFGPFGALVSAFMFNPACAWLVVACDIPGLDQNAIKYLVENRDPSKMATAYRSPVSGFPEPLASIWEPKSYQRLLNFLAIGYSCPRKVLINSDVHVIDASNPEILRNVNTPEDLEAFQS